MYALPRPQVHHDEVSWARSDFVVRSEKRTHKRQFYWFQIIQIAGVELLGVPKVATKRKAARLNEDEKGRTLKMGR